MKIKYENNSVIDDKEYTLPNSSRNHIVTSQALKTLGVAHYALFFVILLCLILVGFLSLAKSICIDAVDDTFLGASNTKKQWEESTTVSNPQVRIHTWLKLPILDRTLVLPGRHMVSISSEGYVSSTEEIQVNSDRQQSFQIKMKRLAGTLDISIKPENTIAEVFLNENKIGVAPNRITNLEAGKHTLLVKSDLYDDVEQPIFIEGKSAVQEVSVTMKPTWAYVTFASKPSGASVMLGDKKIATTPATVKVAQGQKTFTFQLDKHQPRNKRAVIDANVPLDLGLVTLYPAKARLKLDSAPSGATVMVNDFYQGVTPVELKLSADLNHEIDIFRPGFKPEQLSVNLSAQQVDEKKVKLNSDIIDVEFSVFPKDARLAIDGKQYPTNQRRIALTALSHNIVVSKKGYVSQTKKIIPTRNSKQLISIHLLTKKQHFWQNTPDEYISHAGQTMRLFKAPGIVKMGSSRREVGRRSNEVELTARLNKAFYVSQHEITNKQYRLFKKNHSSGNYKRKSLDASSKPVVNVSWQQAALYCNWLSQQEKLPLFYQVKAGFVSGVNPKATGYRLLTEAEWDYLARNNKKASSGVMIYPWGNSDKPPKKSIGNYADKQAMGIVNFILPDYNDNYVTSSPVGTFAANHHGIYDIGGNVSEWVSDWFASRSDKVGQKDNPVDDPLGPDIGEFHVVRGASWARGHLPQLRLAYRDSTAKGRFDIGFRIARYIGEPK